MEPVAISRPETVVGRGRAGMLELESKAGPARLGLGLRGKQKEKPEMDTSVLKCFLSAF